MEKEKLNITHPERLKWFRNVNLLGAVALAGASVVLPTYEGILLFGALVNGGEAALAEAWRQQKINRPVRAV